MLPRLLSRILPRLYELRSFVRTAFNSMGSVLKAKMVVEKTPANTGKLISIAPISCWYLLIGWRRDSAKLLQHAQCIRFCPGFHDLAVGDAGERHRRHRHLPAGRRHALELARVRA